MRVNEGMEIFPFLHFIILIKLILTTQDSLTLEETSISLKYSNSMLTLSGGIRLLNRCSRFLLCDRGFFHVAENFSGLNDEICVVTPGI